MPHLFAFWAVFLYQHQDIFFSLKPLFAAFCLVEVPCSTSYICFTLAVLVLVVSQFLLPRSVPFKVRSFSFEVSGLAVVLRLGVRGISLSLSLVFHCLGKIRKNRK